MANQQFCVVKNMYLPTDDSNEGQASVRFDWDLLHNGANEASFTSYITLNESMTQTQAMDAIFDTIKYDANNQYGVTLTSAQIWCPLLAR